MMKRLVPVDLLGNFVFIMENITAENGDLIKIRLLQTDNKIMVIDVLNPSFDIMLTTSFNRSIAKEFIEKFIKVAEQLPNE